jgi:hypothetical protein
MIGEGLKRMARFKGYPSVATCLSLDHAFKPQKTFSPIGLGTILIFVVVGPIVVDSEISPVVTLTAAIGVCLLMWGISRLGLAQANAAQRKTYQKAIDLAPREGRIDEEGIHIEFQGGFTVLHWNYYTDLRTVDGAIALYKDGTLEDCFSVGMFAEPGDWDIARKIIQESVPARLQSNGSPNPDSAAPS